MLVPLYIYSFTFYVARWLGQKAYEAIDGGYESRYWL